MKRFAFAALVAAFAVAGIFASSRPASADGGGTIQGVQSDGGSATGVRPVLIGTTDGTNLRAVKADSTGVLQTNANDRVVAGTITANGQSVTVSTSGVGTVGLYVTGTWAATLAIQGSIDGTTFFGTEGMVTVYGASAGTLTQSFSSNGNAVIPCAGYQKIRVTATAYTSGTATVTLVGNQNPQVVYPLFYAYNAGFASLFLDQSGRMTQGDSTKATYNCAQGWSPTATTAQDILAIGGSASKTVKIRRLVLNFTATTSSMWSVFIVKRSTADTGGTPTAQTSASNDSSDAAATATVTTYTANPTLGTQVARVGAYWATFTSSGSTTGGVPVVIDFDGPKQKPLVLNGTAEQLCVNLNGQSIAGIGVYANVTFTEE